jgi:hypothetical protein
LREAPDDLEADFQHHYGLDLGGLWRGEMTPRRVAVLASRLPDGANIWAAIGSPKEWDTATYFLHSIELSGRTNVWAKTKDAEKGKNQPKSLPTPASEASQQRKHDPSAIQRQAEQFLARQQRRQTSEGGD